MKGYEIVGEECGKEEVPSGESEPLKSPANLSFYLHLSYFPLIQIQGCI